MGEEADGGAMEAMDVEATPVMPERGDGDASTSATQLVKSQPLPNCSLFYYTFTKYPYCSLMVRYSG